MHTDTYRCVQMPTGQEQKPQVQFVLYFSLLLLHSTSTSFSTDVSLCDKVSEIWRLASWVSLGKTSAKHRKLLKCSLKDHKSVGSCVYLPCASWCFLHSLAVAMWILFRELQAPFVHAFDLAFAWHSNCISTKIMRNLSCQCIDRFWAKPEAFRRIVKNSEAQKSHHKNV